MNHLYIEDIEKMAADNDYTPLALHWEGSGVTKTDANSILDDRDAGDFSDDGFDKMAYCVTWEEYQEEQGGAA